MENSNGYLGLGEADERWPIEKNPKAWFTRGVGPTMALAQAAGISYTGIHLFFKKGRVTKADPARRLEFATGISRLKWLYPEEFGNPFVEWQQKDFPIRPPDGVAFLRQAIAGELIAKGR